MQAELKQLLMQSESGSNDADARHEITCEVGFNSDEPFISVLKNGTYEQHIWVEIDNGRVVLKVHKHGTDKSEVYAIDLFASEEPVEHANNL